VKPNLEQGTSLLILQYWCVSKLYLPMAGIKINTQKKIYRTKHTLSGINLYASEQPLAPEIMIKSSETVLFALDAVL
jgi:hypothetical protein